MIDIRIILFLIVLLFSFNNIEGLPNPVLDSSDIETFMETDFLMKNNKKFTKESDIDKIYDMVDNVQENINKFDEKIDKYHKEYCKDEKCLTCKTPIPPDNAIIDYENCGLNGIVPYQSTCQFKCMPGFVNSGSNIGKCSKISSPSPNQINPYKDESFEGENRAYFYPSPYINCIPII